MALKRSKVLNCFDNWILEFSIFQFLQHNVHLGSSPFFSLLSSFWFIIGVRERFTIINLSYSIMYYRSFLHVICVSAFNKAHILFVNERAYATRVVADLARSIGEPYVIGRWVGGTFTNFKRLWVSYNKFLKFASDDKLSMWQVKLKYSLAGISIAHSLPKLAFFNSSKWNAWGTHESHSMFVAAAGLTDTDATSPNTLYTVPANDDSFCSLYFLNLLIAKTILIGKMTGLVRFGRKFFKSFVGFGKKLNEHRLAGSWDGLGFHKRAALYANRYRREIFERKVKFIEQLWLLARFVDFYGFSGFDNKKNIFRSVVFGLFHKKLFESFLLWLIKYDEFNVNMRKLPLNTKLRGFFDQWKGELKKAQKKKFFVKKGQWRRYKWFNKFNMAFGVGRRKDEFDVSDFSSYATSKLQIKRIFEDYVSRRKSFVFSRNFDIVFLEYLLFVLRLLVSGEDNRLVDEKEGGFKTNVFGSYCYRVFGLRNLTRKDYFSILFHFLYPVNSFDSLFSKIYKFLFDFLYVCRFVFSGLKRVIFTYIKYFVNFLSLSIRSRIKKGVKIFKKNLNRFFLKRSFLRIKTSLNKLRRAFLKTEKNIIRKRAFEKFKIGNRKFKSRFKPTRKSRREVRFGYYIATKKIYYRCVKLLASKSNFSETSKIISFYLKKLFFTQNMIFDLFRYKVKRKRYLLKIFDRVEYFKKKLPKVKAFVREDRAWTKWSRNFLSLSNLAGGTEVLFFWNRGLLLEIKKSWRLFCGSINRYNKYVAEMKREFRGVTPRFSLVYNVFKSRAQWNWMSGKLVKPNSVFDKIFYKYDLSGQLITRETSREAIIDLIFSKKLSRPSSDNFGGSVRGGFRERSFQKKLDLNKSGERGNRPRYENNFNIQDFYGSASERSSNVKTHGRLNRKQPTAVVWKKTFER